MSFVDRFANLMKKYQKIKELTTKTPDVETKKEEPKEEWIWVDGYKDTDENMQCKNYQFEIGEKYIHDGNIEECKSGFHLSLKLGDAIKYYKFNFKNRYFKVKALVKKSSFEKYGNSYYTGYSIEPIDKLVSKEIEFIEEITEKEYLEICKSIGYNYIKTIDDYNECRRIGDYETYKSKIFTENLIRTEMYSESFIHWFVFIKKCSDEEYEKAIALADMDISMDMRLVLLLTNNY